MKRFHILYEVLCKPTQKFYVGMHSTDNLDDGYLGSGKLVKASIKKYGRDQHTFTVLKYCESRELLRVAEATLVSIELLANPKCMNLRLGGEGGSSGHSEETRAKISKSKTGTKTSGWTAESKNKLSLTRTGWIQSNVTKAKISKSRHGFKMGEETKIKIAKALKCNGAEIAARQRKMIQGRHFYNDGHTVILTFPSDPRLMEPKWRKGKCVTR